MAKDPGLRWGLMQGALALLAACGREPAGGGTLGGASALGGYRPMAPVVLKGAVESRELAPSVGVEAVERLVAGNTDFALSLLEWVGAERPGDNVVFGAYSVSQVMAMVYAGARGETQAEMRAALRYGLEGDELHAAFNALDAELGARNGNVLLRNVNQVWMQPGFAVHAGYLDVLTRDYGAPLAQVDFAADPEAGRALINRWVAASTEERIGELLPAGTVHRLTEMVLSNAMYLDAPWHFAFPTEATGGAPFRLGDGTEVEVPTLHVTASLRSAEGEGWRAVALPYRGEELAMLVVVPDDLGAFERELDAESLSAMRGALAEERVSLALPRFELGAHMSLVRALEALGLGSLFEEPDFSGMTDELVSLGAVEHEAHVEVTEEGTRAVAATAATVQTRSTPRVFAADRPFLFLVMDEPTGTVLFLGKVLDPR